MDIKVVQSIVCDLYVIVASVEHGDIKQAVECVMTTVGGSYFYIEIISLKYKSDVSHAVWRKSILSAPRKDRENRPYRVAKRSYS